MKKFIFYSLATIIIAPQIFRLFGISAGLCDLQNFLAIPFLPAFPLLGHLIGKLCISAPKSLYPSRYRNQILAAKVVALGLILILCTSLLLEIPVQSLPGSQEDSSQLNKGFFPSLQKSLADRLSRSSSGTVTTTSHPKFHHCQSDSALG